MTTERILVIIAGNFGTAVMEDPQVLVALEDTREAVMSLAQTAGNIRNRFMRFSHLWTRPIAEALQVRAVYCVQLAASCKSSSSGMLLILLRRQVCSCCASAPCGQKVAQKRGMPAGVHGARRRPGRGWNTRCPRPG